MPHSYNETATSSAASFPRRTAPAASSLPPPTLLGMQVTTNYRLVPQRGIHLPHKKQPTVIKNSVPSPPWDSAFRPAFLPLWRCFWEYQVTFAPSRDSRPLKPWKMGVGTAENATHEKGVIQEPIHSRAKTAVFWAEEQRKGRGRQMFIRYGYLRPFRDLQQSFGFRYSVVDGVVAGIYFRGLVACLGGT
jgi:hypothetical protein